MIVTADERRDVLNLFNVSEAAREIGVGVFDLHKDISAGRVQSPKIRIARRVYFTRDDLADLSTTYKNQGLA